MERKDITKEIASKQLAEAEYSTVMVQGAYYKTLVTSKYQKRVKWSPPNVKQIRNLIPATISAVNVKPGDSVRVGDLMVVYEAMKMLNQCKAQFTGVIKQVNVKVGDKIPKGTVMVEYE